MWVCKDARMGRKVKGERKMKSHLDSFTFSCFSLFSSDVLFLVCTLTPQPRRITGERQRGKIFKEKWKKISFRSTSSPLWYSQVNHLLVRGKALWKKPQGRKWKRDNSRFPFSSSLPALSLSIILYVYTSNNNGEFNLNSSPKEPKYRVNGFSQKSRKLPKPNTLFSPFFSPFIHLSSFLHHRW